jgi:hypothetical protein
VISSLLLCAGVEQRQGVLMLVDQLVVSVGVDILLPPVALDSKMLLLLVHLNCIEIRMATENATPHQVSCC